MRGKPMRPCAAPWQSVSPRIFAFASATRRCSFTADTDISRNSRSSGICATFGCTASLKERMKLCASLLPDACCKKTNVAGDLTMTKIAFIGLGKMGQPMAANLLKAGHDVIGYDIISEAMAKHRAAGGRTAETAATAAKEAEVIISMLPAGDDVRALYLGPQGLIAALGEHRALFIDSSTIDVETARTVAAAAEKAGHEMLDAPVSGGVGGATAGTLTFMVGGSEAAFERAKPVLAAMGSTIVHTGGAGTGQAAKICNNMILGVSMLAVCEAFVLADKLGLAREKLFAVAFRWLSGQSRSGLVPEQA